MRRGRGVLAVTATLVVGVLVMAASPSSAHVARPDGPDAGVADPPRPEDVTTAVLTPEGLDHYRYDVEHAGLEVAAPHSNAGGDLRMLWWERSAPATADQQVCATWDGLGGPAVQAGLALRIRPVPGGVRAVTVTNNIWMGARNAWNVHLWSPGPRRLGTPLGQVVLPEAFGSTVDAVPPLPWRLCARAVGASVEFKAWSLATGEPEPRWGDPDHGRRLRLPPGWDEPGRAGWYLGHLGPGEATSLRALDAQVLERSSGVALGRRLQDQGTLSVWSLCATAGVPVP